MPGPTPTRGVKLVAILKRPLGSVDHVHLDPGTFHPAWRHFGDSDIQRGAS